MIIVFIFIDIDDKLRITDDVAINIKSLDTILYNNVLK
jgi:hypothetical protein